VDECKPLPRCPCHTAQWKAVVPSRVGRFTDTPWEFASHALRPNMIHISWESEFHLT
jgi:hypothetical protein